MQEAEHHGDRFFKDVVEQAQAREKISALTDALKEIGNLGATNRFTQGTLTPDDEGEIRFAVTAASGKVVLAFGKPVEWLGMAPRDARQLADMLNKYAAEA